MTAVPPRLVEVCEHCPIEDTCLREGDCRSTWDSDVTKRINAVRRTQAERVPCPHCEVPAGQTCRNDTTGEPLNHQPAHVARINAAHPVHQEATQ